jgi:hypothetical protein
LFIHLTCYSAPPTATSAPFGKGREVLPPVMEEASRYDAQISFRGAYSKAVPVGSNTRVVLERNRIIVSSDEIHEVIVVDVREPRN